MKKRRVNEIIIDQAKRKRTIRIYTMEIILYSLLVLFFGLEFFLSKRLEYIPYHEDGKITYQVNYQDNEYFKEPMDSDKQYIASLIDNIKADFNYKLQVEDENVIYKYSYQVEAVLEVRDKDTGNLLYTTTDILEPFQIKEENKGNSSINTTVNIDYNYYNDKVIKFINTYELDSVIATLNVNMNTKVMGDCEKLDGLNKESTISLNIPLTNKTMAINLTYDLLDTKEQKFLKCNKNKGLNYYFLICSFIMLLLDIYFIDKLYKYLKKTLKAEDVYEKELKKILNNYKSYIEKINSPFNLKNHHVLKVDTFDDLLEIRETILAPILMFEQVNKSEVIFIIPSNNKIVYTYSLKIKDIRKKLLLENEETN